MYLARQARPRWFAGGEVLAQFPSRQAFHEFVLAGNEQALEEFYAAAQQGPVLAGEGFRARLRAKGGEVSREHPRHERQVRRPAVETVLQAVARAYGVGVEELRAGQRGRGNEARKMAMYLVTRRCDLTLAETAVRFGVSSYGTVAWACYQVRAAVQADPRVGRRLHRMEQHLNQPKT